MALVILHKCTEQENSIGRGKASVQRWAVWTSLKKQLDLKGPIVFRGRLCDQYIYMSWYLLFMNFVHKIYFRTISTVFSYVYSIF